MYWADELAASVEGPQVVNDSKTPSGTVHVGSLRGPVILDVITRALRDRGLPTTLLYGVDDMDPMDAQALLTPDAVDHEMGRPLAHVPDQAGDCHASYARHHAQTFIDVFAGLGIHPDRYYWMSDIYPTGDVDPFIRTALDRAQVVRDVYRRVSKVERPEGWLPVQAVCPACGKVGTTIALDWDGQTVRVECRPDYVTWARSCGFEGRVSPFGGNAKLYWNLEWAAQWSLFGVTIEPCGKDLATAGGSRDRADAIAREVFDREPPLNLAYEFLNIGGRKMSTSKGRGAAAHQIVDALPPEPLRLLFLRPRPNQAIEFDPNGTDAIPRLFDELDRLAAAVAGRPFRGELPSDPERLFGYVLIGRDRPDGRGRGLPPGVRAPRAAGPDPRRRHRGPDRGGEGRPAHAGRGPDPRRAARRRPRLAGRLRAGERHRLGPPRRPPAGRHGPRRGPAGLPGRPRPRRRRRSGRRAATPGRGSCSASPRRPGSRPGAPSAPSTSPSWAGPTARARAGSSPAWTTASSSDACAPPPAGIITPPTGQGRATEEAGA